MAKGKQSKGKSQKPLPDIAKLGNAKPTRIPRTAKTVEQVVPPAPGVNWRLFWIFLSVLLPLVGIVYANALYGQLVFNDTANFNAMNQAQNVDNFWATHWAQAITKPLSQGYVTATYAWDLKSFSWNPSWPHLVNIILHLFACVYLFALVFRLCWRFKNEQRLQADPYIVAFATAALFAVHPLTTGAVTYISGRAAPLLAMNYFLALNCFLFGFLSENLLSALIGYLCCFAFTAIAIFCNSQAITIPFTAIVLGLLLKSPAQKWKEWLIPRSAELVLFGAAAVGLPFLLAPGLPRLLDNGAGLPLLPQVGYWATELKSLVTYYLRCTLIPLGLSPDPPYIVASSFADPLAILGLVAIVGSITAIWRYRNKPIIVFGIELFLVGLLPASVMVQPEIVADQRFYLSLAGICMLAGWAAGHYFQINRKNTIIVACFVLVLFSGLTIYRSDQWKTEETFWAADLKTNPTSTRALSMSAQALAQAGKSDKALTLAQNAVHSDPADALAYRTLGRCYALKGDYTKAAENMEQAIALSTKQGTPESEIADYEKDLAHCYASLKQFDKAEAVAQKALTHLPDDPELHLIVGKAQLARKQYVQAYMQLLLGFKQDTGNPEFLQPIAEAGINSGILAFVRQSYPAAVRAEQINPTRENALLVARAAIALNMQAEVLTNLTPWLAKNQKDAEVLYLLALANEKLGKKADADKDKELALKLDPNVSKKVPIPSININLRPAPAPSSGQSSQGPPTKPGGPGAAPTTEPSPSQSGPATSGQTSSSSPAPSPNPELQPPKPMPKPKSPNAH
jgi:tetratricopeptide (TPR) repeat protein